MIRNKRHDDRKKVTLDFETRSLHPLTPYPIEPERMSAMELGTRLHREIEAVMGGYDPGWIAYDHLIPIEDELASDETDTAINALTQRLEPIDFVRDRIPERTTRYHPQQRGGFQHCSPAMIKEFVRGYRLARGAGLLGD